MKRSIKYIAVAAVLAAFVLAGCTERKLEHRPEDQVNLAINWVDGPVPAAAVIILYPVGGGPEIVLNTPATGYSGPLPAGEYDVIVYSADPQNVGFRDMNYYAQGQVYDIPDGVKLTQPGYISMGNHIAGKSTLVVPASGYVNETIDAYQLTHTFRITFTLESSASGVSAISGEFIGACSYVQCGTLAASADRCPIDYVSVPGPTADSRTATITAFGYTLDPDADDITMDIVMGADTYSTTLDLTPQLQAVIAANGGKLPLNVDLTINIGFNGIQMTATVTSWSGGNSGSGTIE